ncbi:ComF family protein [Paracoccus cavernae]
MPARHAALVRGRPVLLVDDVMASGATLAACADCLAGHGAGPISVAVLARAVKDT